MSSEKCFTGLGILHHLTFFTLTNFRVCTVDSDHYLTVTVKTFHQGISLLKSAHCVFDSD